jgi:hypothetical protein
MPFARAAGSRHNNQVVGNFRVIPSNFKSYEQPIAKEKQ